jgi:hypothetical protein
MTTVPVYLDNRHFRDLIKLSEDAGYTTWSQYARTLLEAVIDEEMGKTAVEEWQE